MKQTMLYAIMINNEILPVVYDHAAKAVNALPDVVALYIRQNQGRKGTVTFEVVDDVEVMMRVRPPLASIPGALASI